MSHPLARLHGTAAACTCSGPSAGGCGLPWDGGDAGRTACHPCCREGGAGARSCWEPVTVIRFLICVLLRSAECRERPGGPGGRGVPVGGCLLPSSCFLLILSRSSSPCFSCSSFIPSLKIQSKNVDQMLYPPPFPLPRLVALAHSPLSAMFPFTIDGLTGRACSLPPAACPPCTSPAQSPSTDSAPWFLSPSPSCLLLSCSHVEHRSSSLCLAHSPRP